MNPWDWQNQPTMNSQGYANSLSGNIQGAYGQMNQDTNTGYTNMQNSWNRIGNLQQQQGALGKMDQGGYPAMQNSYGLGAQPAAQAAAASNNQAPQNNAVSNASAGFNPWSMSGEANSR